MRLEELLHWAYAEQESHGEGSTFDAALVHDAVLKLGPEAAAMITEAAVTGKWPEWIDPNSPRPVPAEPSHGDNYGRNITDEFKPVSDPKALADLIAPYLVDPPIARVGRPALRRTMRLLRDATTALRKIQISPVGPLPADLAPAMVLCEELADGIQDELKRNPAASTKNLLFRKAVREIVDHYEVHVGHRATLTWDDYTSSWRGEFLDFIEQVISHLGPQVPWMIIPKTPNARAEAVRDELELFHFDENGPRPAYFRAKETLTNSRPPIPSRDKSITLPGRVRYCIRPAPP